MPVSGLVLSLSGEPGSSDRAVAEIARDPRITIGAREANQLAIVADTPSSKEDQRLWRWLQSIPGVLFIEVAFVGFDDEGSVEQIGTAGSVATTNDSPWVNKGNTQDGC